MQAKRVCQEVALNSPFPTTILVVDDSSVMRSMIARGLVGAGVPKDVIRFAANGRLALEAIHQEAPGLLVTDVNMPEMTGAELVEILAAEGRLETMPAVVITSISNSRELLSLVRAGAAAVIRKPVDPASLIAELRPFVEALLSPPAPIDELAVHPEPEPQDPPGVDLDASLVRACADVLDRVPGCESRESTQLVPDNRVLFGATLQVIVPFRGAIWVWCDQFAANRLSVALCGVAPERDDSARLDAVAELLNIVAGEYLAIVSEGLGDATHENHFGVPSTFVVRPGTTLPPQTRTLEFGESELLSLAVSVDAGDVA